MYKNLIKLVLLVMAILCVSCDNKQCANNNKVASTNTAELCVDPVCRIVVQPYGDFPHELAQIATKELVQFICDNSYITITDVCILPNKQLPDSAFNPVKTRYRASVILNQQINEKESANDVVIGLTDKDISTSIRGHKDWGILGLAYIRKSVCIVSTFRITNKSRDLWKLMFHEFNHAFMGHPHCPKDDQTCIMKDCKGKADFAHKTGLCDACKKLM